ncbi:MAG: hypothetical protein ABIO44_05460, partial [Saprospiraceae bacterium]
INRKNYEKANKVIVRADKYSVGPDLLFCKVAYNYLVGNREMAIEDLKEAIIDDASQLTILTGLIPTITDDTEIRGIIRYYSEV